MPLFTIRFERGEVVQPKVASVPSVAVQCMGRRSRCRIPLCRVSIESFCSRLPLSFFHLWPSPTKCVACHYHNILRFWYRWKALEILILTVVKSYKSGHFKECCGLWNVGGREGLFSNPLFILVCSRKLAQVTNDSFRGGGWLVCLVDSHVLAYFCPTICSILASVTFVVYDCG